jgi:hypothetical protein
MPPRSSSQDAQREEYRSDFLMGMRSDASHNIRRPREFNVYISSGNTKWARGLSLEALKGVFGRFEHVPRNVWQLVADFEKARSNQCR